LFTVDCTKKAKTVEKQLRIFKTATDFSVFELNHEKNVKN